MDVLDSISRWSSLCLVPIQSGSIALAPGRDDSLGSEAELLQGAE
jgi:hypothetical protein